MHNRMGTLLVVFAVLVSTHAARARTIDSGPAGRAKASRSASQNHFLTVGNLGALVTNYGLFGDANSPRVSSMEWPLGSTNDYLYEGRLWFGALVGGVPRVSTGEDHEWGTDWPFVTDTLQLITGASARGDFDTYCEFADMQPSNTSPAGILVRQRTSTWTAQPLANAILYDMTFTNIGTSPLSGCYVGIHMDGDISSFEGAGYHIDDLTNWDRHTTADGQVRFISYLFDGDNPEIPGDDAGGLFGESMGFLGTTPLLVTVGGTEVPPEPVTHYWWDWNHDPQTDEMKYDYMASHQWLPLPPAPFDFRYLQAFGPFSVPVSGTVRIVFAHGVGGGLAGLRETMDAMHELVQANKGVPGKWTVPVPSGTILTQTWTKANSPYRITETMTVPDGEMLTIEPGVDVLFDADAEFVVRGGLHAVGTVSDSIRFIPGSLPQWGGLRLSGIADAVPVADQARLSYVRVSGGRARELNNGGGIHAEGTVVELDHSVISGNGARSGGGIYLSSYSSARLRNCIIAGNLADSSGGAIYASLSDVELVNCTISDNTAAYSAVHLAGTSVGLDNAIVWGNDPVGIVVDVGYGGMVTATYSDIAGGWAGRGNIDADPQFVGPAGGDYRLQAGSPCRDSGNPYLTDADGSRSDMGACGGDGEPPAVPRLELDRTTLLVASAEPEHLVIRNTGWADLSVTGIDLPPGFSTTTNFPQTILPGDSVFLAVQFVGASDAEAILTVHHTDVHQPEAVVTLIGLVGTGVRGDVAGTWSRANAPYRVIGPVTVPKYQTLTIEPGVDVLFDVDAQFVVNGALFALGTETDSIRFLPVSAPDWGGLRFLYGDSSSLRYCRISGGHAEGFGSDNAGGGVYAAGTVILLAHVVLSGNVAAGEGGGVAIVSGPATLVDCCVIGNTSGSGGGGLYAGDAEVTLVSTAIEENAAGTYGGGVFSQFSTLTATSCSIRRNVAMSSSGGGLYLWTATVDLTRCAITGNRAALLGGGMRVNFSSAATLTSCTIADNAAEAIDPGGGGLRVTSTSPTSLVNTVVWGNTPNQISESGGLVTTTYSDIQGGWAGSGNMSVDPLFVDAANGDYHLLPGSPCIDAGDPNGPPDPDGTRADLGAFPHLVPVFGDAVLPNLEAAAGGLVFIPITVTFDSLVSADLAFIIDPNVLLPSPGGFVVSHAFDDQEHAQVEWNLTGSTVRISLTAGGLNPRTLDGEVLIELAFVVNPDAPSGQPATLVWLPFPETSLNERPVRLTNGSVTAVRLLYGDVSGDRTLSAYDASLVLRYVVQLITGIDQIVADVTGNGFVSSFDAAHILWKVLDTSYVFPVEGGPLLKPVIQTPRILSWERQASGWSLRINDRSGVESGELTFELPTEHPVVVTGAEHLAYRQDGVTLMVAFAEPDAGELILVQLEGEHLGRALPRLVEASFNEGAIPFVAPRPVAFGLAQNVPNPFNPTTTLRFATPASGVVNLAIYDVSGRPVRTLVDGPVDAGYHEVVWDGRDHAGRAVASGIYLYRLTLEAADPRDSPTNRCAATVRRMVLVR